MGYEKQPEFSAVSPGVISDLVPQGILCHTEQNHTHTAGLVQGWYEELMSERAHHSFPLSPLHFPPTLFENSCSEKLFDKKGIGLADSGPFSNGTLAKSLVFFEPVSSSARMGVDLLVSVFGYAL